MAEGESLQIVMEKVAEERQSDTALFLSGCFSLPPASTRGIAASGPIALMTDLTRTQVDAILAELAPSLPDGVTLTISKSGDTNISRLQWPRPPRIYGRPLDEFAVGEQCHEAKCPICGGNIRITQEGSEIRVNPAVERRRGDTIARPAPTTDKDPLFSGIKPLSPETASYASIRSLQAGDTGFWMDYNRNSLYEPEAPAHPPSATKMPPGGETTHNRRTSGRNAGGLSAFMKPGVFALVLGRTHDQQVVKMVAEIMGLQDSEAREKCMSLGLCVARGIALEEAQTLLARFRNLGARARIVKPM